MRLLVLAMGQLSRALSLEEKEVLQGGRGHDELASGCTKYVLLGRVGRVGKKSSWVKRLKRRRFLLARPGRMSASSTVPTMEPAYSKIWGRKRSWRGMRETYNQ